MASSDPTRSLKQDQVLGTCAYLARAQVWPHTNVMNPRQWLTNFKTTNERLIAHELLNGFMYFTDRMAREMMRSAVQKIIPHLIDFKEPAQSAAAIWRDTVDNLVVLPVTGEIPNPSDSGMGYVRLFRDMFDFPEERLLSHSRVLSDLLAPPAAQRPSVLFVDDFVGSGSQFITLWRRPVRFQYDMEISFAEAATNSGAKFFYCPLIATSYGLDAIKAACGDAVILSPAYVLTEDYNALHESSRIWTTPKARKMAPEVLAKIATREGMPNTNGLATNDWRGYHKLGLGLAIRDCIPDACLGVFHFDQNGWKPLFNKAG